MSDRVKVIDKKICHMTSVHGRYDIRIFHKECKSLSKAGYEVHLIVADGKGDEVIDHITIHDVGKSKNRFVRMWKTTKRVLNKARKVNADLYHFHDPELLVVGLLLKGENKHVIYDVHEDLPRDILAKEWIHPWLRKLISKLVEAFENFAAKKFSAIVVVVNSIKERFDKMSTSSVIINNFPILDEFKEINAWKDRKNEICFVGGISKARGIFPLVRSLDGSDYTLNLAGRYSSKGLREELRKTPGWKNVNEKGYLDRLSVKKILDRSKVGIVHVFPSLNSIAPQPNKLFEYMAAGIPAIVAKVPHWKNIVEKNNCGICVNIENPEEIAKAVGYLLGNQKEAEIMGLNGRKAVEEIYNWSKEEKKLISLYESLL
ncbi:MAG: glycosyl transferase [Alphaproteobacteria bacterium]|nr:MAG: glycosyl transferase [Alphaproteobacteria bacterium]